MEGQLEFFAPCPRGLDRAAADELRAMGIRIRPLQTGVSFRGGLADAYRVCLFSRIASRVLLVLARIDAATADELYAGIASIPWEDHIAEGSTLSINANGTNDALRNTQFIGQRVKDAICDRLREREGWRPSIDRYAADINVSVAVRKQRATVYLNLSGAPLHQRGYRAGGKAAAVVEAPMKEALAAGMLFLADWPALAAAGGSFCDPLCGSGTLAIEAALMAADIAPGILRAKWGFAAWKQHDAAAWDALLDEARARREAGIARLRRRAAVGEGAADGSRATGAPLLRASDIDPAAVALARANAQRAGVAELIRFEECDIASIDVQGGTGLVAMNPPYGERLMAQSQLPVLYSRIGAALTHAFEGWTAAVITPDASIDVLMGLSTRKVFALYNGAIPVSVRLYSLDAEAQAATHAVVVGETEIPVLEENTQQFVNRLKRRYAQLRKWARRNDIHAYRVYDADLPDYNVAIDVYEDVRSGDVYAVVSEYAAPTDIDHVRARRRLVDVLTVTPCVLGIESARVVFKRRTRKAEAHADQAVGRIADGQMADARFNAKPATQRTGKTRRSPNANSLCLVTQEHGLRFKVNLSDYLDTGLFLDHRPVRELVMRMVAEQLESGETQHPGVVRALNLFAYTGTATVHAAAGGATSTTTVDMSATYLDWARENMALNGFGGSTHSFEQADCLQWVQKAQASGSQWDFIFVDPPTFSNSKRMGAKTWDVQRDHVELLRDVAVLLAPRGRAIFSCNLRSFKPDMEALSEAGIVLEDITARTIDEDFARNPRIHKCYLMSRA